MDPSLLQQYENGATKQVYHKIGVILAYCGSFISFIGIEA